MTTCMQCFAPVGEGHEAIHLAAERVDPVISSPVSRLMAGAMYREAKRLGREHVFLSVWRRKRAEWLLSQTLWQRKWQDKTRRVARARHHDSIATRERYVRCA